MFKGDESMMYPFVKYSDGTEVVFSNIRKKENNEEYIWICFERPTAKGFDTVIFELPSYEIVKRDGKYTDEEIERFKQVVEQGAATFFKYARDKVKFYR